MEVKQEVKDILRRFETLKAERKNFEPLWHEAEWNVAPILQKWEDEKPKDGYEIPKRITNRPTQFLNTCMTGILGYGMSPIERQGKTGYYRNMSATPQPEMTAKINLSKAPWTMHEFFAGSGLVAYGLKGMFRPVWSNDICPKKAAVYEANFDSAHFVLDDIKNVSGAALPDAHLSWASFPCQDLSLAGSIGGIDAKRSGLVWEWLRILKEMAHRPALLLIENVIGLLSAHNGANYTKLHNALLDLGYKSGAVVLNASLFVPQSRPRVFIIAVQKNIAIPDELQDDDENWLHNKTAAELGLALPDWIWWKAKQPPKRETKINDVLDFTLPYDKDNVLSLIPPHHQKKLAQFSNCIATGYRRIRNGKQCLELRFDGLAGCLRTPEGGSSKQFLVVKRNGELHARVLSPREAARLMGAPDSFNLPGTYNSAYKAMGDAVALPVASFVGKFFLMPLAEVIYNEQQRRKPA